MNNDEMDKLVNDVYKEAKKIELFAYLKFFGVFVIVFLVSYLVGYLLK